MPLVVQIVYVPALKAGKFRVVLATGFVKATTVVFAPLVALKLVVAPPCKVKVWLDEPTVSAPPGVRLKAPELVMLPPLTAKVPLVVKLPLTFVSS